MTNLERHLRHYAGCVMCTYGEGSPVPCDTENFMFCASCGFGCGVYRRDHHHRKQAIRALAHIARQRRVKQITKLVSEGKIRGIIVGGMLT